MNPGLEFRIKTPSFASIAKVDIKTAVKTIEAVLGSGLSLALGFLASAAGLTKIASSIKTALDKIQEPAKKILEKIKNWIVKMFSSLVKKVTPGTKPVTGDKSSSSEANDTKTNKTLAQILKGRLFNPLSFIGKNKQTYKVWVEINSGQPKFILNPTPTEATQKLSDYETKMKSQKLETTMNPYISLGRSTVASGLSALQKELTKKVMIQIKLKRLRWGNLTH